jgi:4-hydroxybenzoate polyprenyltransferase
MLLIRPRAWWYNKVPLSITLVLLLVDGRRLSLGAVAVMALVVLAVCAVGNYGYALNELFDIDEDARLGRINAAASMPAGRMWAIIIGSAILAEICASVGAGVGGMILTTLVLCLPLAYSVPPVRVKERKWLGVAADASAAHVFPAILALLAVAQWSLRPVPSALAVAVILWAAATGLRGILSHQLATSEQDRGAGLTTVVHDLGNGPVERFVIGLLLPLEVLAFGAALVLCNGGPVLWIFVALYLGFEIFKTISGRFRVTAFRPDGQAYVPFVEESFYKVWGPLVLAVDAARIDLLYLLFVPAYILLFKPHLQVELARLRSVTAALRGDRATEPSGRSNEGS